MKKRILFLLLLLSAFCLFCLSVFATDWFGEVEIIDLDKDGQSDLDISETVGFTPVTEGTKTQDALAKVKCSCGKEHTFPAYYICTKSSGKVFYCFSYTVLNGYLADYCGGSVANGTSVIAYEIPNGYTSAYSGFFHENIDGKVQLAATSLEYFSFALCETMSSAGGTSAGKNWLSNSSVIEVNIGKYLKSIPVMLLYSCKSMTSVIIPEDSPLTTISSNAFAYSSALEEIYIPSGVTLISENAFQKCTALRSVNLGKVETFGTRAFSDTAIVEADLSSAKSLGFAAFELIEDLREVKIENNTALTSIPSSCFFMSGIESITIPDSIETIGSNAFDSCKNLTSVKISENSKITVISGRVFANCGKLTAFYIPSGVTAMGAGGSNNSPFNACTNLYFVNDPGATEKPSVYYMPKNLTTLTGEIFKSCTSLNDVIVFGEKLNSIPDGWAFCNSNAITLVFLGDMVGLSTVSNQAWNNSMKFYLCNKNDLSKSDLTTYAKGTFVFCNAEGNTDHLTEKEMATEANCDYPKMVASYCFCGAIVGTPITEGEALGHKFDAEAIYTFTSLLVGGEKSVACTREGCDGCDVTALNPILVNLGYSVNTVANNKSFTNGYMIDNDLLMKYEEVKGVTVTLGFAFNSVATFTNSDVTLDSFAINTPIARYENGIGFDVFNYKMKYTEDTHISSEIIIASYIIENGELTFMNRNEDTSVGVNGFEAVSYTYLKEKYAD